MEQLQAERQAAIDDATARAQQAEIDAKAERQKLMQTTINKIKDYGEIVVMKYEFSHETSYEKNDLKRCFILLSPYPIIAPSNS